MRKFILLILLILTTPLFGVDTDITKRPTSYWLSGNPSRDVLWNWLQAVDQIVMGSRGTGETFYADSNVANEGDGRTVTGAKDTIEEAIQLCVADRGDIIYVLQGHNEDDTAAAVPLFDADIAGITISGLGEGSLKPTLDFVYATSTCKIGADNVRIENIRFRTSLDAITIGLEVESGADYAQIIGCEFGWAETSTDEFAIAIKVGTSTGSVVAFNTFNASGNSAVAAIVIEDADYCTLANNTIFGDHSTAQINNAIQLCEYLTIEDNILWNGDTAALKAEPVWELLAGTVGISRRNYAACNVATENLAFVGDAMMNFGNYYTESVGGSFTGHAIDFVAASTTSIAPSIGL